mmetsp:Transcript_57968/g.151087  ORF Transcript_57968/g.151087 Transcript_57968/m.151087 type:complete len:286 (+) Transcript_57968:1655-2512(+)
MKISCSCGVSLLNVTAAASVKAPPKPRISWSTFAASTSTTGPSKPKSACANSSGLQVSLSSVPRTDCTTLTDLPELCNSTRLLTSSLDAPAAVCRPAAQAAQSAAASAAASAREQREREQENAYLRKNVEHLRKKKHQLEDSVFRLDERVQSLEQQNAQYKALYEHAKVNHFMNCGQTAGAEMSSLHEQLNAVMMLKDALNLENMELQRRLQAAERDLAERGRADGDAEAKQHGACVICMDNLANVVCLPCKHLSLCSFCAAQQPVGSCPICRADISEKLQIYMP